MVRKRGGRKRALGMRVPMPVPLAPNDRWSLDFVSDQFVCGRRFRIVAVFDDCTRECLAAIADTSLSGLRVAPRARMVATPVYDASNRQTLSRNWMKVGGKIIGSAVSDKERACELAFPLSMSVAAPSRCNAHTENALGGLVPNAVHQKGNLCAIFCAKLLHDVADVNLDGAFA